MKHSNNSAAFSHSPFQALTLSNDGAIGLNQPESPVNAKATTAPAPSLKVRTVRRPQPLIKKLPVRVGSSSHGPVLSHASGPIQASISASVSEGVQTAAKTANTEFLGLFGPGHGGPELRRLMRIADPTMLVGPARIAAGVGQLVLLAVACGMFFQFVAVPIGDFALTTLRFLVTGA